VTRAEALLELRSFEAAATQLDALLAPRAAALPPALQLRGEILRGRLAQARGDRALAQSALARARGLAASLGAGADASRVEIEALQRSLAASAAP
jgi:hypothetical protein